ncbi:hypothetical protein ACNZ6T_002732 [Enterococcus faecium]|uniref:hypothetical protein n=1 Tax=Enterococcus TaxID=1350 RepID=UPI000CF06DFC|nr:MULTISPECIES: hypothetical protein [Enterococcus]EHA4046213.1 hypothetical protein [Enterococcus faecalis]EKN1417700.1 hypothetical protein [Enterococcus faecalis]MEB7478203.1 hypothetical protein [Enterococcus faecium]MEB8314829.1 hypothetical protein [Enterococcus faecium]MEB8450737.1 hypothetical protein [Enterococcus faecium]
MDKTYLIGKDLSNLEIHIIKVLNKRPEYTLRLSDNVEILFSNLSIKEIEQIKHLVNVFENKYSKR